MATFLERYLAGEYEQVWAELVEMGPEVRHPSILPEAAAVARETMRRARANIQTLLPQLRALGYRFGTFSGGGFTPTRPYSPPSKTSLLQLKRLDRLAGPLPLSLQAWYEVVGSVHLVGQAPWGDTAVPADAVVVDPVHSVLYFVREWLEEFGSVPPEERCTFDPCLAAEFAPDEWHKDDTSGGPPYAIHLPNASADARVEYEWHNTTFVSYLRECFACGGFPGLARLPGGLPVEVRQLAAGLLPL
ncbi:hypothetical protein K7W42_04690 [Deinococcus sp. HMF7604]|uniref:hypothetical protein n=1 Tax=Deinococcus betulae TaxID=2873312 RepID=UPI001CCA5B41|nr:hypothetical protein [Deinococcus betulae]MBZ9750157.1 hypothetical protein [Deinococcus betulae]